MKIIVSWFILTFCFILISTNSSADNTPLIKVHAQGKASAPPDQALFNIIFREIKLEVESANNAINTKVKSFIDGLEHFELESQSLDSGQITVTPNYRYKNNERFLQGYQVERRISFVLNQLNQLQGLISHISRSKVSSIDYIHYKYSNEELLKEEALNNAIKKATKLGETIAEGFNVQLSTIHSVVHLSSNRDLARAPQLLSMGLESANDNANYNIKPIEIESHIEVEFNFED